MYTALAIELAAAAKLSCKQLEMHRAREREREIGSFLFHSLTHLLSVCASIIVG